MFQDVKRLRQLRASKNERSGY